MSGALKSSGVAAPKAARAFSNQVAKPAPALVFHGRVGQIGPGGENVDDGLQGVDGVIAGRGRLQTVLHQAAAEAAQNSLVAEYPPLPKGCEAAPVRRRTDWTEERIIALGDLFEAGWSHELMGQALGLSKGSISAKLDRLAEADPKKWTRTATIHSIRPGRAGAAAKARARRAEAAMIREIEESVVGVTLLNLDPHMCRWPMGYADQWTFCGAEKVARSSYCEDHDRRSRLRQGCGA